VAVEDGAKLAFDAVLDTFAEAAACEHPRPLAAPGVRGETTLRYKVNGSAEMTEYALVRASQR
jgi:hypothetical protein